MGSIVHGVAKNWTQLKQLSMHAQYMELVSPIFQVMKQAFREIGGYAQGCPGTQRWDLNLTHPGEVFFLERGEFSAMIPKLL